MSEQINHLEFGRNWIAEAEFDEFEMHSLMGPQPELHPLRTASYNFIAEFLHSEVGLFEYEVPEWFRSNMRRLAGQRPIDIWLNDQGFEQVYDLAKQWLEQTREDLAVDDAMSIIREEEKRIEGEEVFLKVADFFRDMLRISGVDLLVEASGHAKTTIWNGNADAPTSLRWQIGHMGLEEFRATIPGETKALTKTLSMIFAPDKGRPRLFKSGIGIFNQDNPEKSFYPCDFDPLPTYPEIVPFMEAIGGKALDGTLKPVAAA